MNIIAFSGKARSGKTTAARAYMDSVGATAEVFSIATEIKRRVLEDFSPVIKEEDMLGSKDRSIFVGGKYTTVRNVLIEYGRMFRKIDESFWIRKVWHRMSHSQCTTAILDDLRYRNEAEFLVKEGGRLIRIQRPGVDLIDDPSETELDDWEFNERIVNNGSIDLFQQHVRLLTTIPGVPVNPGEGCCQTT